MPVNIYEPITNPISGETFKALSFSKEAFVMQWIVQPKGYVPFEHIHLKQEEIFRVKKGEMDYIFFFGRKKDEKWTMKILKISMNITLRN